MTTPLTDDQRDAVQALVNEATTRGYQAGFDRALAVLEAEADRIQSLVNVNKPIRDPQNWTLLNELTHWVNAIAMLKRDKINRERATEALR